MKKQEQVVRFPGIRQALDGNDAVIACERESTDAAGAFPITPSTQMGEGWAAAAAEGYRNIAGRPLIFIEPEGEHAAAAVTAGLAMTGLRAANFSSGQGIAYMHESLYAAVGKRLTYVLNIGARAMTKATLNVHAGHDDYHCADDTGFFQVFAASAQQAADLNILAHRIAELALTPGIVAQDGFLTTHLIESMRLPERELIEQFLGCPDDIIETPTAAQRIIFGETRRRIPELWDVDNPVMAGVVQNQDAYMQSVAAQKPFFFDHVQSLTDTAFADFHALTGRRYDRVMGYRVDDADYLLLGQGSIVPSAEAVVDYLRTSRGLRVGVVNLLMFRPFPADLIGNLLKGRRGVAVLERLDQPLAVDLPLMREIRATLGKCLENGRARTAAPHPGLAHYTTLDDLPELYSGSFGLGSRDLQPEALIGAVENMLPGGNGRHRFYLSMDFLHDTPHTPKQALHQESIEDAYPALRELSVRGSENPDLMPAGSTTVRMHSVGGWGAITTGKNLAMILFDLLGYHIKANPRYGSEKKGQPTTYYLAAAPEPIRVNCEYYYVDTVLSPDPHVLAHTNALAGLRKGGAFIIQSDLGTPERVWAAIPDYYQRIIVDQDIRLYFLDAFRIAREEASDADLRLRMQGIAFQGAFFAASGLMQDAGFTEESLLDAIHHQLTKKFGDRGSRVVQDNLRVVRRGFDEVLEVTEKPLGVQPVRVLNANPEPPIPAMVAALPQGVARESDIHRFWEQTGNFYSRGMGNDNLADPFMALSVMPASTSLFRDMTGIRFEHPAWIPENCTACGDCYTVCPDTAIPGLVSEVQAVLDRALARVRQTREPRYLARGIRQLEPVLRTLMNEADESTSVSDLLARAIDSTVAASDLPDDERAVLVEEFTWLTGALGSFRLALTRPFYTLPEQDQAGNGGLLSITVDPYRCKGCMACVAVCNDEALMPITQTADTVAELRDNWDFWLDLPNTPRRYQRIDDLEQAIGALHTLLLDKDAYLGMSGGDGACLGCTEKTVLHLFVATVEALMRPRVEQHVAHLDALIGELEATLQAQLTHELDVDDTRAIQAVLSQNRDGDLTLANVAADIESLRGAEPIDTTRLEAVNRLIDTLKMLRARYTEGVTGRGRSNMGILNATGCSSVWGSTWPYNPYPFPWANHLFQDSASMAMGVFEGHMAKMAAGFRAVREAEALLRGEAPDENALAQLNWRNFSDDELHLCPPVVVVGGDGAMYDIGFQNLSRAMMSGKPLKILVLDTQVYSNTGGQACTSGFMGQVSDMAAFGPAQQGKEEMRKEIGLIAMAHRTTFVMQSTIAHASHMIEGFIEGLMSSRPALFNLYCACQPEHLIGDDMGYHQAKLAVESRAYPLFKYNPDNGKTAAECFDLDGNPDIEANWPTYPLTYTEGGRDKQMQLPMTFADFAMTEGRFRKHFRTAPPDTWHDGMMLLSEYLLQGEDEREDRVPYLWTLDSKGHLSRLLMDAAMVASTEERLDFWVLLRALAGADPVPAVPAVDEAAMRQDIVSSIARGLVRLAGSDELVAGITALADDVPDRSEPGAEPAGAPDEPPASAQAPGAGYVAPWIDTAACTACDECTRINSRIFAYGDDHKAVIHDPEGGPYRDLVRAAEKCTARIIHPGLPRDRSAKDIAKWIKRGERYN